MHRCHVSLSCIALMENKDSRTKDSQTIEDFGKQWTAFKDNEGYYGSVELLLDITGPCLEVSKLQGKNVADIGSGTGRIVNMLLDSGVAHVTAVEPSDAFYVLKLNTHSRSEKVRYLHATGDALEPTGDLDYVFSIGVLHHIENPSPTLKAMRGALKTGGVVVVWLYGYEGNERYVKLASILRRVTVNCPDYLLKVFCYILDFMLDGYIFLCRIVSLPMRDYFVNVYAKVSHSKRRLILFDQLNPSYAKYYTEQEARALLEQAGFSDVRTYHRHGYSWTVCGTKSDG